MAEIDPFSNLKVRIHGDIHAPIPLWGMVEELVKVEVKVGKKLMWQVCNDDVSLISLHYKTTLRKEPGSISEANSYPGLLSERLLQPLWTRKIELFFLYGYLTKSKSMNMQINSNQRGD